MDKESLQRAIEVVEMGRDIKSLIGGYNFQKQFAAFFRDENHPWLELEQWNEERLIEQAEWHDKVFELICNKLESQNVHVYNQDFFDGTEFIPEDAPKLKYRKNFDKTFEILEDGYSLEDTLRNSEKVIEAVKDKDFAIELYCALCNVSWFHEGIEWGCSWRYAGGILASLRDVGEDYMNFYCSGNEGTVSSDVAELLDNLGWSYKTF